MNTKNKQDQKNQGPRTRQDHGPKKQGQNPKMHQDQEHPETRLTR
jgi:hypothetical protein